MHLLLDTHIVLWCLEGNPKLPPTVGKAVAEPFNRKYVSAASAWEIGMKVAIERLEFPVHDLVDLLKRSGFMILDMTVDDALAAAQLPRHHKDPFDRMLVAQALNRGLTLVSVDRAVSAYDVPLLPL